MIVKGDEWIGCTWEFFGIVCSRQFFECVSVNVVFELS